MPKNKLVKKLKKENKRLRKIAVSLSSLLVTEKLRVLALKIGMVGDAEKPGGE